MKKGARNDPTITQREDALQGNNGKTMLQPEASVKDKRKSENTG